MRVVFAGTPEVAAARPRRGRRHPRTSWSAWSPGPTRRPAAAAGWSPSPVAQRAEELGVPVLKPEHPRDPEFQDALRALRARLLPGRRLRRAAAAVGARHPAARLGQPALLGAARLARRRAGAARDLGRRRGHRRDHVPDRQGARRRPDVRRDDRDGSGPTDTAGDLLGAARRGRRRAAGAPPSTASRTARSRRATQPADGVSLAPKITVDDARVDWSEPAVGRRPAGPRLHARARRLDDVRRRAAQARPGAPPADGALPPGELDGRQERGRRRHRHRRASGSARSRRSASKQMPAADWARGLRLEPGARSEARLES